MQSSLLMWTLVTGATSLIRNLPPQHRFLALLVARAAQGLAQSCIMPATSAMAAKYALHRCPLLQLAISYMAL